MSLPSITRRTDKGLPRYADYEESDIFILSGSEDSVPVLVRDERGRWMNEPIPPREGYAIKSYRPRTEGLFARIERWTSLDDDTTHWRSISKDNILTVYGFDANSRIADPRNPKNVFSWLICRSFDDKGNAIVYDYAEENGEAAGNKIVPDLATSIPVPTNGGKTYVFHIRRGIKFSNGQTLKPSDFVTTFERQFTVPGPTSFYSGIVGASKCSTKGCNLSKGVVANDSAYTLTINLTAPDPELMDQLSLPFAFAVPAQHLAEADRQQRAAGHRAVHVEVVQPQLPGRAGPQPVLPRLERAGAARGLPERDHREVRAAGVRRGDRGAERPGQRGVRRRQDPVRPAQPR